MGVFIVGKKYSAWENANVFAGKRWSKGERNENECEQEQRLRVIKLSA
jgi:hypothetical protein